jgi:hypothetical protein
MRKGIARSNLGGTTLIMVFVICLLPRDLSAQVPRGYLQGSGSNFSLSPEGRRYMNLISPEHE